MAIKGILFDKDGTLIEFNNLFGATYLKMLQLHYDYSKDQATEILMRAGYMPETGGCRGGSPMASGTLREVVRFWWPDMAEDEREARRKFIDENFDRDAHDGAIAIIPLQPIFDELKAAGYVLGVATNDIEASAHSHMTKIGVIDYFEMLIGADSVVEPKPHGNMIKRFAEAMTIKPHEIAMVGDNAHDINEARAGGAGLAIGVLSGNSDHDDLAHIADHVIGTVADLLPLLQRLG